MKKQKVSANYYKGAKIRSIKRIFQLVNDKKSIYHSNWGVKPAAVLMGMQFKYVCDAMKNGKLFEINK